MKFWDTSAILPLILEESSSSEVRALFREDSDLIIWWATRVESVSAVARLNRGGALASDRIPDILRSLTQLLRGAALVHPVEALADRAERLLFTHALRAADALQLAAALVAVRDRPQGVEFVTLDQRLRTAALGEGFAVLP